MARPDQQQIRQGPPCQRTSVRPPTHTDLVLAQAKVRLQLAINLLQLATSLMHHTTCRRGPLVQIGHQDFCMFRADVPPLLIQDHSDVTDVPQTQAFAIRPEGFTASPFNMRPNPAKLSPRLRDYPSLTWR